MDVLTLRQELESLLVDELGVYTLGNGATTPAVAVRATGEPMPAGTRVSGVECIIRREPAAAPVPSYANQKAFRDWTVYLVDWSGSAELTRLSEMVLQRYGGTVISDVAVPEGAGPQSQKRLVIRTAPEI